MLLKRAIRFRAVYRDGRRNVTVQPELGRLPKLGSREKPREILRTPDGEISPVRYSS
jgi:hypothetical protein